MPSDRKITKDEANYRGGPVTGPRRCERCSMFREPNACTLVEGFIARRATCRFWEPRKEAKS